MKRPVLIGVLLGFIIFVVWHIATRPDPEARWKKRCVETETNIVMTAQVYSCGQTMCTRMVPIPVANCVRAEWYCRPGTQIKECTGEHP